MVTEHMCGDMPLKEFLWKLRGFPTAIALFIKVGFLIICTTISKDRKR